MASSLRFLAAANQPFRWPMSSPVQKGDGRKHHHSLQKHRQLTMTKLWNTILIALFWLAPVASGFGNAFVGRKLRAPMPSPSSTTLEMKHTLVLVRHGESTWNKLNKFTGWVDCPLSEEGEDEAKRGGALIKVESFKFDKAYTSTLKRAIKTLWIILEEVNLMYIPIVNTWTLNERWVIPYSCCSRFFLLSRHMVTHPFFFFSKALWGSARPEQTGDSCKAWKGSSIDLATQL